MNLVEIVEFAALATDDAGGDAHGGAVFGHFLEHHGVGGDLGVVGDLEGAENFGARAHQDVVAEGGVTLADVLAGTTEGHTLVEGAVVPDLGGLADDDAHTVVDEQTLADGRTGVDLNTRCRASKLADGTGREIVLRQVELVRHAVGENGVYARIQEQDLHITARSGVALTDGVNVVADLSLDGGKGGLCLLFGGASRVDTLIQKGGKVKIKNVITHGRCLLCGVCVRCTRELFADFFGDDPHDALQRRGEYHIDNKFKDEIDAGTADKQEINSTHAKLLDANVCRDGVENDQTSDNEHARIDKRNDGSRQKYGDKRVFLADEPIDPTCKKARKCGFDQTDACGDIRIVGKQKARKGIGAHHAVIDVDDHTAHKTEPCAGGRAEDHRAQRDGNEHKVDRRAGHRQADKELQNEYDGCQHRELHHFQNGL